METVSHFGVGGWRLTPLRLLRRGRPNAGSSRVTPTPPPPLIADPEELGLSSLGGQPNHPPPLTVFPSIIAR